jgi:ABC-type nitrate/sulfonate/bicarbonate transport system permease component
MAVDIDRPPPLALAGRMVQSFAMRYSIGIGLIVVWQIATAHIHSIFFPTPVEILKHAIDLWLSGPAEHLFLSDAVFKDVLPSIGRLLTGWSLAVVFGTVLGVLMGRSRQLFDFADPILQFLRSLPGPALVPIFIILFGTETEMRIILIAFGTVWPVLLNTIDGVRAVDPVQIDTARSFRLPTSALIARTILPAAMPKIVAGAKISLSLAIILMVVSEFVASTNGIGYEILNAQMTLLLTDLWCGILLLALLGFCLNALFGFIEERLLYWHRGLHQRADR